MRSPSGAKLGDVAEPIAASVATAPRSEARSIRCVPSVWSRRTLYGDGRSAESASPNAPGLCLWLEELQPKNKSGDHRSRRRRYEEQPELLKGFAAQQNGGSKTARR